MPFALVLIGIFLVVAASRGVGNIRALGKLLVGDFTGQNNFLVWIFALGLIGLVGYIPGLQKFSRAMMVLLFVVLLLATKGGFLAKIQEAFKNAGSGSGDSASPAGGGSTGGTSGGTGLPGLPSLDSVVRGGLNGLGGFGL